MKRSYFIQFISLFLYFIIKIFSFCSFKINLNSNLTLSNYQNNQNNLQNNLYTSLNNKELQKNNKLIENCFITNIGNYCFPSLIISGFPKCGSSFLFKMLSYNNYIISTKRKELCLGGIKSETWLKYFQFLPNIIESYEKNKLVMSGCLHLQSNIKAMKELCITNMKVIYVIRDVADMLWSAYNFWCIKDFDDDCYPGKHTSKNALRSPEHFHQLILNGYEMGGGIPLTLKGNCFKKELIEATRVFGEKNILVLKSESMLTSKEKIDSLKQIKEFLFPNNYFENITQKIENDKWFESQSQVIYRVNSGKFTENRGEKNIIHLTGDEEQDGRYEVSQFKPMFKETRKLIYQRWEQECLWIYKQYKILYSSCNHLIEK